MFASLGVELSSAKTEEGLNHIQNIVTTVQKQVYRMQGSLNKLVMDDKGSTLICLWGLSPLSHEDDAARAVLTGFNIIKELNKLNTWCNIGISSGECFSGVVGTAGARKEFSVLGDVANLSARIMGSQKNERNVMSCDLKTRILCQNYFSFNYIKHAEFKGKSISMPVFRPINPQELFDTASLGVQPPETFLKTHMNRLDMEGGTTKKIEYKTFGFESILEDVKKELLEFFNTHQPFAPYLLTIKGEIGSGKTNFVLHLIEELVESELFEFYRTQTPHGNKPFPILASHINPESDLSFLNMWRPILRQMLCYHCEQKQVSKSHMVKILLNSTSDGNSNKKDLLCEILGITDEEKNELSAEEVEMPIVEQIEKHSDAFSFIKRDTYDAEDQEIVIQILYNLVKVAVGEAEDISDIVPAYLNNGGPSVTYEESEHSQSNS